MTRIIKRGDDSGKYTAQDFVIEFQEAVRKALCEKDMTHADLAELLGVSPTRVSQLFREDVNPSLRYIGLVLTPLGYTMEIKKRMSTNLQLRTDGRARLKLRKSRAQLRKNG